MPARSLLDGLLFGCCPRFVRLALRPALSCRRRRHILDAAQRQCHSDQSHDYRHHQNILEALNVDLHVTCDDESERAKCAEARNSVRGGRAALRRLGWRSGNESVSGSGRGSEATPKYDDKPCHCAAVPLQTYTPRGLNIYLPLPDRKRQHRKGARSSSSKNNTRDLERKDKRKRRKRKERGRPCSHRKRAKQVCRERSCYVARDQVGRNRIGEQKPASRGQLLYACTWRTC